MADYISAPLVVAINPLFLRAACTAWTGVEMILQYKEWRGLLHNAYETTSGFDYITPYHGNPDHTWPERRGKKARSLAYFEIGLPVPQHDIQIGDGRNTLPEAGFSLVSVDAGRRQGVLEYRIGLPFDGVLDEGEHDDIFTLVPGVAEDDLPHNARAFFVIAWDAGYVVRRSACVILLHSDETFGKTFFELSEEERAQLLHHL